MTMPLAIENTSPLGLEGVPPSVFHAATEQALVEAFQNLNFVEETNSKATLVKGPLENLQKGSSNAIRYQHPLRLYAKDCPFYLRTGKCRFGLQCKYNHPLSLRRVTSTKAIEEKGSKNEREPPDQIECKYYLTPGGCKYGKDCRYVHSKVKDETAISELSFLGLPIRLGEKECPFYMRTGSCGYGSSCRFHHPDPMAMAGYNSHNSTPKGDSVGELNYIPENQKGELDPLQVLRPSHQTAASLSPHVLSEHHVSLDHSYKMNTLAQGSHLNSKSNEHQVSFFSKERTNPSLSVPAVSTLIKADIYTHNRKLTQNEEFPERPGQLECAHFMKTGDCKYGFACRYHHPKNRASPLSDLSTVDISANNPKHIQYEDFPERPGQMECPYFKKTGYCKYRSACRYQHPKSRALSNFTAVDLTPHNQNHILVDDFPERPGQLECAYFMKTGDCKYRSACRYHHPKNTDQGLSHVLSEKGLPVRPDRKICSHYEQYGICKYGINCLFYHPENLVLSNFPASSVSEPVSSNEFPSLGGIADGWV